MSSLVDILVTGGGGLLGSALGRAGARAIGRASLDITDPAGIARCLDELQPTAVINAAAQARVDLAEAERERTWAVNADGPRVLAGLCRERGIRLVHLSTDYVLHGPDRPGAVLRPTDEPAPLSAYAQSKLDGERAVLELDGVAVRVQWLYHPGHPCFFTRCVQALAKGGELRLVVDQTGCPTPTDVLVPALLRCARGEPTGLFHYACTGEATAWQWIEAAATALGLPLRASELRRGDLGGAPRPARSCLDSSGFVDAFGCPPPTWRGALEATLERNPLPWP